MDTALAYLVSVGIAGFGIWILAAAAPGSSVSLFLDRRRPFDRGGRVAEPPWQNLQRPSVRALIGR